MAPYYGPDEDAATIMLERMFLAGDFISGVGYGIQLLLYLACARYLWNKRHLRQCIFLLSYITLLLCVESIFEVAQSYTVQMIYVDNRNYPGALALLGDMESIWKVWCLASNRFPRLTASGLLCHGNIMDSSVEPTRPLPLQTLMKTLPEHHAKEYVSLLTIVVESASLYSVFALIFLVTYALNDPVNSVFLTVASFTQQIANYLIIYRLAQGRAWHKDTVERSTAMEFAVESHINTTRDTGRSTMNVDDEAHKEDATSKGGKYASFGIGSSKSSKTIVA
ncbi:hypothetical protein C0991_009614 [Blastosporella zonata]|nr:hypothetical protein C0991_009614 [Blastosporella zonata]